MDKEQFSFLKIILVFGVLITVLFIISNQIQTSVSTKEIDENQQEIQKNRDLQLEARDINNDFRNTTLDYLGNITAQLTGQNERISNLEHEVLYNKST